MIISNIELMVLIGVLSNNFFIFTTLRESKRETEWNSLINEWEIICVNL